MIASTPSLLRMRSIRYVLFGFLLLGWIGRAVVSAEEKVTVDPERVQEAIRRGLHYLRRQQQDDGSWQFIRQVRDQARKTVEYRHDAHYDLGLTALAALALVENGVPPSDPAVRKAYEYVRRNAPRETRTYSIALSILLLEQLGNARDRVLIQRLAHRLVAGQLDSGGWTYTCPVNERLETDPDQIERVKKRTGVGDNSNTQFAVLGLWAARRVRARVENALELVEERFRNTQSSSGGWDYRATGEADTASMTAAGCFVLAIAAGVEQEGSATGDASLRDTLLHDPAFKKGLERVAHYIKHAGKRPAPYFLWSVERLGVVLATQKIGDVDWYTKGAKILLDTQESDGSWRIAHHGVADTSLALLFLGRGNLVRDLTYALQGDPSKPFMRIGREGKPESYKKWRDVARRLKDGDIVEIHGNGPFELVGQVLSQRNLTIRAGKGYTPVIVRKHDPLYHPDFEPTGHAIFIVRGGPVSIEGIEFRVDPDAPADREYAAIAVESGELLVSHCHFSNTAQVETVAVELNNGASARIQDSFFTGFTASLLLRNPRGLRVAFDNCLLFTTRGIEARSTKRDASCQILLGNCTIHTGEEFLALKRYAGAIRVEANACVFRTPWLSREFLTAARRDQRTWAGDRNVFDVLRWIGRYGRPLRDVENLDDWRRYWKGSDEHSAVATAHFAAPRLPGAFKHDLRPTDWQLAEPILLPDAPLDFLVGCDVYRIGPGPAYERFRFSERYAGWRAALAQVHQKGAAPAEKRRE